MLTQSEMKKVLRYYPRKGVCVWLARRGKVAPGTRAGSRHWTGYRYVTVFGVAYPEHHLAWLYMSGVFPIAQVDHRNRIRDDNRWCNLRPATSKQNNENASLRRDNVSGTRGVSWDTTQRKWRAYIYHNKKQNDLGFFTALEDAKRARLAAERKVFTHSEALR
jgi:hypothetical protein